jgi:hypothetical protein
MNVDDLAPQLSSVMDAVPVAEGLILCDPTGKVLIGQTLTEMNHTEIAKKTLQLLKTEIPALGKGKIIDLTIGLDTGFLIAVANDEGILIGILGEDGKSSVGLLTRQLKNIMSSL